MSTEPDRGELLVLAKLIETETPVTVEALRRAGSNHPHALVDWAVERGYLKAEA